MELEFLYRRSSITSRPANPIDDFLEGFPSVAREQVISFLEEAKDRMIAAVS
jgi:uncharacterized protein (DUF433 family)